MKYAYAVQDEKELREYQEFAESIRPRLDEYIDYLQREFSAAELPRSILWTSAEIATNLISDIPIPAYTNQYRIVMTPSLKIWQEIYLKQLIGLENVKDIAVYYREQLGTNHILQILGHELAHHSQFFLDDFDETSKGIWFEEGMAEYISRHFFLTQEEFDSQLAINKKLVESLMNRFGNHSIEEFGKETYTEDYASIFFEYWRSFLAVNRIVNSHSGSVKAVFESYHAWDQCGSDKTLSEWFGI